MKTREIAPDPPRSLLILDNDQKLEAALRRFEDHTETLRVMSGYDLQIFGGYMTLQLGLAAWLAEHPPSELFAFLGILVLDFTLASLSAKLLHNNYRRRDEIVTSLRRVLSSLRFTEKEVYLADCSLDGPTIYRPWWYWYLVGIGVAMIGVVIVVSGSFIKG